MILAIFGWTRAIIEPVGLYVAYSIVLLAWLASIIHPAMIAYSLEPFVRDYIICAHRSVEQGHRFMHEKLHLKPMLDLNLRLGEGTGAALAMNLVEAAVHILTEVATFEEA